MHQPSLLSSGYLAVHLAYVEGTTNCAKSVMHYAWVYGLISLEHVYVTITPLVVDAMVACHMVV